MDKSKIPDYKQYTYTENKSVHTMLDKFKERLGYIDEGTKIDKYDLMMLRDLAMVCIRDYERRIHKLNLKVGKSNG